MAASGKTPNFNLPQYKPLDTVSMLVTFNGAMSTLDSIIQEVKTTADTGAVNVEDLERQLGEVKTELAAVKTQIEELPRSFPIIRLTWTIVPGIVQFNYYSFSDNEQMWLSSYAYVTNAGSITINLTENTSVKAIASTPNNLFNLKDNTYTLIAHTVAIKGTDGSAEGVRIYVVRQNSITYLCVNWNTSSPVNLALNMAFSVPLNNLYQTLIHS